ncbi:EpsG family protein [Epilithonimonas hungarica]|uniref:EpsG family protein n=1 Tax=Epilithonimonas hungarica TaxID=454006 RepID=A0A1G7G327_9FLAO|nr:EpsG family protein [Epilithonimonas hungarica]SDE82429.1 EpsG family protein [Epilithonimonas hungarica]
MIVLHPVFTILFILIILFSFQEVYSNEEKKTPVASWLVAICLILFSGLRGNVGADYPVYRSFYSLYFPTLDYSQIYDRMLFRQSAIDIEWMYVLLNKIVFAFGGPFQSFTLVSAIITIGMKMRMYYQNSVYPIFTVLLFFIPGFFIADSGHMRQALGMTMCVFSYQFIKDRKIWWFLLCLYIAYGFHKSAIIFLPAYWLVLIPLNSNRIFYAIIISVILSPLHVYDLFSSFLGSLNLQDVSNGYNGYIGYEDKASSFMDGTMVLNAFLLIAYDKSACKKIWYYEYMRNIVVMGVCLYFIFRDNPVFSTRLVGVYIGFSCLIIPNIIASLNLNIKRLWHFFFVAFMIFYYFVFASYQGKAGRFTPETYRNFLWSN